MLYQSSFRTLSIFVVFLILFASSLLRAQYAPDKQPFEIQPDETIRAVQKANARINIETGYAIALYNVNQQMSGATPEETAFNYLQSNTNLFGLSYADLSDLVHHHTRTTNMGHVVRFRQVYQGLPVNKSELTVTIDHQNKVDFVMNSYEPAISVKDLQPKFPASTALSMAQDHINIGGRIKYQRTKLMIYANRGQSRLAYEVTLGADQPVGDWRVYVDAITQEMFKAVDVACYCKHDHKNTDHSCSKNDKLNNFVDGTGNVFDPDPLSSAQVAYGTGGYTDNNDLDSPDLNGQLVSVTLRDIDFTSGVYTLKGPYAEVVDVGSPSTGLFTQATNLFNYNRGDDAFEAVNTYFHIDSSMRYMNLTLMEPVAPYQYTGGVKFDPQGVNGTDNSFYSVGSGHVEFGEGCVDDAEDSDVIHHELGHGIHDWITMGGLSQNDGLSEGSGDYWAQSYNRGFGGWSSTDPAYNWVFNWDGHNVCWNGRVTDYAAGYPGGLVGQIHTDGQIWSTCMMKVWDAIGQQKTDKIFLSGLSMTNGSADQNDAANAAYTAAQNLNYPLADLVQIYTILTNCGYTLPLPPNAPPIAEFVADETVVCRDNGGSVNFTDNSIGNPTSWNWSFPGATPSSSTMQNPTVVYNSDGVFNVTLIATNANGSDTSIVSSYITVVSGSSCPNCTTVAATDVPIVISDSGTPTITSTINFSGAGTIADVNVPNLNGDHTWINDLTVTLTSPAGTTVTLMDRVCSSEDNFDLGFDDGAATGTLPCPPVGGASYIPATLLAAFNGEDPQGAWVLTITDNANLDGGTLLGWDLEVCFASSSNCNLSVATTSTPAHCGLADGTATVTTSGGTPPFTYQWDAAANNQTTTTAINLPMGTYTVVVSDGMACQQTGTVTVGGSTAVTVSTTSTNVTCFGANDGTSTSAINGGTPPYVYTTTGGWNLPNGTGLAPGAYAATVTDANGCVSTTGITISEPPAITATLTSTDENGTNGDGTATATAAGGTPPFTYDWSNGQTGPSIANLSADIYTVTITDANGCTLIETVTVDQNTAVTDIEHLEAFELYPNPSDGQFTILVEFETSETATLAIYNVLGQEIFSKEISGQSVSTPVEMKEQASGIYFAELSTEEGRAVVRFVKN